MESALRHLAEDGRGLGSGPPPPSTPAAPAGILGLRRSFQEQRELGMDGAWSWSRPSPGPHALPQRHPWADPASLPPASRPAGLRAPRQSSVARCSLRGGLPPGRGTDTSAHRPVPPQTATSRHMHRPGARVGLPGCPRRWGSWVLAAGRAYRLAFVFLLIRRLVCLGGCSPPSTRGEDTVSSRNSARGLGRSLCADTARCSEDPWGGPTRFG